LLRTNNGAQRLDIFTSRKPGESLRHELDAGGHGQQLMDFVVRQDKKFRHTNNGGLTPNRKSDCDLYLKT
jgi:hypothetical protein